MNWSLGFDLVIKRELPKSTFDWNSSSSSVRKEGVMRSMRILMKSVFKASISRRKEERRSPEEKPKGWACNSFVHDCWRVTIPIKHRLRKVSFNYWILPRHLAESLRNYMYMTFESPGNANKERGCRRRASKCRNSFMRWHMMICVVKPQHMAMSITNQAKGKSIQFIN